MSKDHKDHFRWCNIQINT